ncbi:MAG: adenine phosphoribosyltransferase [Candidatus Lambdaproteobacteria bacterium RIFOXYD1_FULL_56_27]|uniref:Adenine phosphoribosyltransferase n=1 Tax=Candidatus Lambdaproteobacteria bacterium RIFOXYD2_FULL_56_26 TaxID=1817773 RepID=A0A1F6H087_9PROT|nr:MAG: adenine phosphoribosyltransferase [Candidatus Lambdaproteobacteria bacterium RIFOXYC1_FULL_56_13]OGH03813.1 MAG: adenine phosphoribosyltransferase [Candidatus Lambdaproteobacteria bacterium RIFOXYD2_FULL_56_26]OGH08807.1 MAG: adenine phosphoribosyltransferase [Candidatus Lambdaproteobacteria bacterium RIFOXYD1_FULL_56_27]
MEELKGFIRNIPDFPKKGIQFKDVTTLFQDRYGFQMCLDAFESILRYMPIDKVAGIESRGFVLGAALADRLKCGMVLVRKKGKLPGETIRQSYELEYGTDELEVHLGAVKPGERVLLVDDLLATGGTLEAAAKLIEKLGGKVESMACIIELTGLNGRKKLGKTPFISLISYDED